MVSRLNFRQWLEGPDAIGASFGTSQSEIDNGLSRLQYVKTKIPHSEKADQVFLGKKPNREEVVSFDFDGVLHTDLHPGTAHPVNFWTADLTPREEGHKLLRQEAKDRKVVIVSARDDGMDMIIEEFCDFHNLPVSEVYVTNNQPKLPLLKAINAVRHYDDKDMTKELKDSGIEFIHLPI